MTDDPKNMSEAYWKRKLTPDQYPITQEKIT